VSKLAGIAPVATIATADEIRDIEAARASGLACAAATWGYAAPLSLQSQKPDAMFRRMEDIATLLTTTGDGP